MNTEKLNQIFTQATPERVNEFARVWNEFAKDFGVTEKKHEDMLLSTIYHEVGSALEPRRENLNYTPSSLRATFSRYKKNPNWSERDGRANGHAADQEAIGNIAYADRIGNGDIDSGDGFRFRGGSFIQTTGRYNWEQSAKTIQMLTGDAIDAENLERESSTVQIGLLMTFAFFFDNNIKSCNTMNCCTDKVNRHTSSRQSRNQTYDKISKLS